MEHPKYSALQKLCAASDYRFFEALVLAWILRHPSGQMQPIVGSMNWQRIRSTGLLLDIELSADWYKIYKSATFAP